MLYVFITKDLILFNNYIPHSTQLLLLISKGRHFLSLDA